MRANISSTLAATILAVGIPVFTFLGAVTPTEASVPVRLTVYKIAEKISASVPASLPICVVNGDIRTADDAAIVNYGEWGSIKVESIEILDGAYPVGNFENFKNQEDQIALSINGIGTAGAGFLDIEKQAFPTIAPGESLPIDYEAKINVEDEVDGVTAAQAVFILAPVGGISS